MHDSEMGLMALVIKRTRRIEAMMDLHVSREAGIIIPGKGSVSKFGIPWKGVPPNDPAFKLMLKRMGHSHSGVRKK